MFRCCCFFFPWYGVSCNPDGPLVCLCSCFVCLLVIFLLKGISDIIDAHIWSFLVVRVVSLDEKIVVGDKKERSFGDAGSWAVEILYV